MKILIHPQASKRYVLSCYLTSNNGRPQLKDRWFQIIKSIEGQWLDVETDFLFRDQFNTSKIEGVNEYGLRIMNPLVKQIVEDARNEEPHLFLEWLVSYLGIEGNIYFKEGEFEDKLKDWYQTYLNLTGKSLSLSNHERIIETIVRGNHLCRPISPLATIDNYKKLEVFYFSDIRGSTYSEQWALDNGVID
jgi:hypothetical protein